MALPRPFEIVRTADQWLRASHESTFFDADERAVELAWTLPPIENAGGAVARVDPAGLAFDAECRLYHSIPEEGRVERLLWALFDPLSSAPGPAPEALMAPPAGTPLGQFLPDPVPAVEPRALTVTADDRLFVADPRVRRIHVFDVFTSRLLRSVPLAAAPFDLAARGSEVVALLAGNVLVALDARHGPHPLEPALTAGLGPLTRLTARPGHGGLLAIERAWDAAARVVPLDDHASALSVPLATDLECASEDVLVVARRPGDDFRRWQLGVPRVEAAPLKARDYDGKGIVRTPDGAIGFWTRTTNRFRHAVPARVRYATRGRVTTFRLDSGEYQTEWGRLFVDACIPPGTRVRVRCFAMDEPPDDAGVPRTPPGNVVAADLDALPRPDLSPPTLPVSLAGAPAEDQLHRRANGRETPWLQIAAEDRFETYEAPLMDREAGEPVGAVGRFLWIAIELSGDILKTPRVRCLRAEHPGHDWMRRLPKVFSRDATASDFLRRYLAMFEGFLAEVEAKASLRRALLDPASVPDALLPWLAGFVGLIVDERWSIDVRRHLLDEIIDLWRMRGTVAGLRRFLEIVTQARVNIVEHWRLRPKPGAVVGGAGMAAFAPFAHRFTVVLEASLDEEALAAVRHALEEHRPAHTLYEMCSVAAGMRVGRGMHLGLTTLVGKSGGFATLQLGASVLGRGAIVGRAQAGTVPGASRLGGDSRVG